MEGALIATAIVSTLAGAGQAMQQKQAVQEQKKAQRAQTAMETYRNTKAAVQGVRQARIQRATIAAMAENAGAKGSGAAGSMGSIQSQLGGQYGFQQMQSQNAINITRMGARAADNESKANAFQAVGQAADKWGGVFSTKLGG